MTDLEKFELAVRRVFSEMKTITTHEVSAEQAFFMLAEELTEMAERDRLVGLSAEAQKQEPSDPG